MILLFFPPVAVPTPVFKVTTIEVSFSFLFGPPIYALVFGIVKGMNFATEVLPIMCIYTCVTGVVLIIFVAVWTPDCFKVEQIKICVALHSMEIVN